MTTWKLVLTWTVALATSLFIVKATKIGPVVLTVSEKHGMGVHTGDLLALPGLALAAYLTHRAFDTGR